MSKFYDGVLIDSINRIRLENVEFSKKSIDECMNKLNDDVKRKI